MSDLFCSICFPQAASCSQALIFLVVRDSSRVTHCRAFVGRQRDVVGALTPVSSGVAQVFHDLLVELRLLLVAEVEEGEEEDRQEES